MPLAVVNAKVEEVKISMAKDVAEDAGEEVDEAEEEKPN